MLKLDSFPILNETTILKEALETMGKFNLGIACIVDSNLKLLGLVTDGDIRRKLLKVQKPFSALFVDDALEHCIKSPICINPDAKLIDGVNLMGAKHVWDLPVVDDNLSLVGLLHLHPAISSILGE
ncbi:CBS domain protein [Leptospira noguchii serovar Panama str. CZ214]|uniref:CBS domain protein n=2 Tax=Leptospira noguchii TaxID=28182 RepID=T0FJ12_9LEPT|nr:CBS domain protein [Leptospira noguchii serovar Panama str. CZ214]